MMRVPVRVAVCDDDEESSRVPCTLTHDDTTGTVCLLLSTFTHQMQTYIDRLIDKCHRHERNGRNSYM